jgi:hypothetical protein
MKLTDITHGTQDRPARIILAGVEKIGKSTFASGAPAPIFVPVKGEEGIDALDVSRFPVANTFKDIMDAMESLATEDHDFKTVVIDSASTTEPLIFDDVCAEYQVPTIEKVGGGFGKGYAEAVKRWRDLMAALDYLRAEKQMGCILICHVAVKTLSDPTSESYDQYVLDLNKQAVSALQRWSDAILFANAKTFIKKEQVGAKEIKKGVQRDERVLFTQKRPAHPGGGRGVLGQLPYELPLDWNEYEKAIKAAKGEQ